MKLSQYFLYTQKEKPKDVVVKSHEYMIRSSMIKMFGSGFYAYMPLGLRALKKVESVVIEELDKIGAIRTVFPSLVFKDYLEKSGRWTTFRGELFNLTDSSGMEMALAPTHEELFTEMMKSYVSSYKQLPKTLYQITSKFRNEIRPRFGLIRSKEFRMKDAYSFDVDDKGFDESYQRMKLAHGNILTRLGLKYTSVKADSGAMGGDSSEEFVIFSDIGEDEVVLCKNCGYSANMEKASQKLDYPRQTVIEIQKVETPDKKSVEDVVKYLDIKKEDLLKTVLYRVLNEKDEFLRYLMVFIRGDFNVNEVKLQNYIDPAETITEAKREDFDALGLPMGFVGPYQLQDIKGDVIVDVSLDKEEGYYVVGANEANHHYKGFNFKRDCNQLYEQREVYEVQKKAHCIECGNDLERQRVIEIGHIFKLRDHYTKSFDWKVVNEEGDRVYPLMGCYGIGIDRLLAGIIEQNHDDKGIIWTKESTPFDIIVLPLNVKDEAVMSEANKLYEELQQKGYEVLFDDTDNRAGFKFGNADLIGIPIQIIIGHKKLAENKIEIKLRQQNKSIDIDNQSVLAFVEQCIEDLI